MIIYFSASHRRIERDMEVYRAITQAIYESGHIIANNWLEVAGYIEKDERPVETWTQICENSRTGIKDADLLIAEASGVSGFGVGYEVGLALEMMKPVLVLIKEGEERDSYVSGVHRGLMESLAYSELNLRDVIEKSLAGIEKGS